MREDTIQRISVRKNRHVPETEIAQLDGYILGSYQSRLLALSVCSLTPLLFKINLEEEPSTAHPLYVCEPREAMTVPVEESVLSKYVICIMLNTKVPENNHPVHLLLDQNTPVDLVHILHP